MSYWRRSLLIILLSIGCLVTLRLSTYLLGMILRVPPDTGIPLVSWVAALAWSFPLLLSPSLRKGVGTFRLPLNWSALLLIPIIILNWVFSLYFVFSGGLAMLQFWGPHALGVGIFEELIFRGYAFHRVPEAQRRFVVFASAFCFALVHLPWLGDRPAEVVLQQVIFAAVVGTALGVVRMVSGSLAWCMLLHAFINAAKPAHAPALEQWTPYVLGLVAIAAGVTIWRHPVFQCTTAQEKLPALQF